MRILTKNLIQDITNKKQPRINSKYITHLKRSEGQLRGIQKMIYEDCDCTDIIQLTAVRSNIKRVIEMTTACINQPLDDSEAQKERLEKAVVSNQTEITQFWGLSS